MGNTSGGILNSDQFGKRYRPSCKFTQFPRSKYQPPGCLLIHFRVLPPGHKLPESSPNMFWWVDCQFLAYKDNEMIVTFGAYLARPGYTPTVVSSRYNGLIYTMDFKERTRCCLIKGTKTSTLPHVIPHPNSVDVGFLGVGTLTLMDLCTLNMKNKDKGIGGFKYIYLDISPNGQYFGMVTRSSKFFQMTILRQDTIFFPTIAVADCHRICKGFYGNHRYTDHVECKFSPDSKCFALGASFGMLFVVTSIDLKERCLILPGYFDFNEMRLSNARCFDFDPRYKHRMLTFASSVGEIHFFDIDEKKVLHTLNVKADESVQCIRYGVRGELLAVATSEAVVYMYSPDTYEVLYSLDHTTSHLSPESAMVELNRKYPTFIRMSFSYSGDIMSITATDGIVRLWQLHPNLSLNHLCKMEILKRVNISDVHRLPLPPKIIMELLEWPSG